MSVIFVRYSREFVITVIVITEFDCILAHGGRILLIVSDFRNQYEIIALYSV